MSMHDHKRMESSVSLSTSARLFHLPLKHRGSATMNYRRDHNVFVVVLSHRLNASNLRGSTDVVNTDRCLNILINLSKCHHRYRKNKHSSNSVHSNYLFLNSHSSALIPSLPFLMERGNVSHYWKQQRLSFLLQCHFNKCLMPALREDYVDKAASRDLWVTCAKL